MKIERLLETGETDSIEFKTAFGKEVIISLVAFANTNGGKVVVGVDNDGNPIGLEYILHTVIICDFLNV